ncbi:hypothetical protein CMQ_124 [Grosmannia clavigera kw1407]|uniref:ER transporter 6TM N-terminal domain-containing protein n=1 Tax=Grosmannia clavigera (strain kw1407 / UAMH 11150) TaxID=655863 RepID=F0XR33_GROCL|nr:uncharacterized protein CMQ_124 [Grosmannia clavigera kw1407]EFW99806.1 hypothetical protein CMQ_124 [Grosmannia clavigera kw1407]
MPDTARAQTATSSESADNLDTMEKIPTYTGSLAPVIGIAMYQSDRISNLYPTLGYLIPIISVLGMPILPRGKSIQTLMLNVLAICVGSALALLMMYSGVEARRRTAGTLTAAQLAQMKATGRPLYNASQSAVMAVWLFVATWAVNVLRAKNPAFNLPVIVFSILINVTASFGPLMTTMVQAEAFIKQILTAMLFAQALSAGVSLFVFPMSSRKILMGQMRGKIGLLRKAVSLQGEYLRGLEREDMYALATVETAVGELGPSPTRDEKNGKEAPPRLTREAKAAQSLRATIGAIYDLSGKMQAELRFAKRDAAFGKLTAHDLGEMVHLLRNITVPVTGMSTIMDIFRRTAEHRGWKEAAEKEQERRVWNEIMQQLHEPFAILSEAIDEGLEHAGLQLDLLPKSKAQKAQCKAQRAKRRAAKAAQRDRASEKQAGKAPDTAATSPPPSTPASDAETGESCRPGDEGFAAVINRKVERFHVSRSGILRLWARERGLLSGDTDDESGMRRPAASPGLDPIFMEREHRQAQLYVLLYMEQLMHATGEAVQDLVTFADLRVADGTMDQKRLLFPTLRRMRKWVISVMTDGNDDSSAEETPASMEHSLQVVFTGDGFGAKRDPEHLPPTNGWQRFGNRLRAVSRLLGSAESLFGLRAACATMTVGIICFLERTQVFFREQRLVWAMIIIAIGMMQTSGQSIFGFFCRVGGSALAMVFSLIIWYITDQTTVGTIVFLWLFLFCEFYFLLKHPRFMAASMITLITQVLIIGYELQVRRIGITRSESTGQRYYPIYELAPYRLATVAAGCFVAFIWTIFPQPQTDRAWLRRDLSATMYLLANYFSVINETLRAAIDQTAGDVDVPDTPGHRLAKVRQKLFSKLMTLLPSLQAHSDWQRWEPSIGGRYPRVAYEDIILRSGRILNYLTLISYTVVWKPRHSPARTADAAWLEALNELIRAIGPTHYTILSTLTLLSNSLLSGQSLPPYIPLPRPYELTRQLLALTDVDRPGHSGNSAVVMASGSTGRSRSGSAPQPPRRRNSIWSRHSNAESKKQHLAAVKEAQKMKQKEDTEKPGRKKHSQTAAWKDLADDEVNTATGLPTLMRVPTKTASSLSRVLDASNMEQTGYTEFAVLQVCSTLVCDDLEGMIQSVSGLVGVVDFSFVVDKATAAGSIRGKGKTA